MSQYGHDATLHVDSLFVKSLPLLFAARRSIIYEHYCGHENKIG